MKSISEISAGIAVIGMILTGVTGFNVQSALAEHNAEVDSHPKILVRLERTNTKLEILTVKLEQNTRMQELVQTQNKTDHQRMFATLERIADKVNTL